MSQQSQNSGFLCSVSVYAPTYGAISDAFSHLADEVAEMELERINSGIEEAGDADEVIALELNAVSIVGSISSEGGKTEPLSFGFDPDETRELAAILPL